MTLGTDLMRSDFSLNKLDLQHLTSISCQMSHGTNKKVLITTLKQKQVKFCTLFYEV